MARKLYLLGWVAGFMYSDGHEWLFAKNRWESLDPSAPKKDKALVLKTKEEAIAHAKTFGMADSKLFVREWALESSKEMDLPPLQYPHGEKHFVD